MAKDGETSNFQLHSLLDNQSPEYVLMQQVAVEDGRRQLKAAGFIEGPQTGNFCTFEIWMSVDGYPQMIPYIDHPHCKFFDGDELHAALVSA